MKKLFYSIFTLVTVFCLSAVAGLAQSTTKDDVHLFQSYFRDAPITDLAYGQAITDYTNSDFLNTTTFALQIGYAITQKIELGTGLSYRNLDFDEPGIESGIADIPVFGRYIFLDGETKLSGGVFATIPIGDEIIGQSNLDFGAFGAVRHPVSNEVVLTGTLGIDFLETAIEDYEASLHMGAGIIYSAGKNIHILGELAVQADTDYSAISGGIDYKLAEMLRFRANLLLGLDVGAPDFGVSGGFLVIL